MSQKILFAAGLATIFSGRAKRRSQRIGHASVSSACFPSPKALAAHSPLVSASAARYHPPMPDLLEHLDETIRERRLLRRGQSVLVAVSGGVDSMVLLYALHKLSGKHRWKLAVAHLNHCLRGKSSDADARLVARAARRLRVRAVIERADVKVFARANKLSIEMAARQLRHAFLGRTAAKLKINTIAVAHHADDQIELFFLRLLRGSGSEGLAGMKWRGAAPFPDGGVRQELIRPLLDASKADIREFAARQKISFREDASNESLDFQRNRIRHELLPLLRRKYQPALDRTIARVMEISRAESDFMAGLADCWLAGGNAESAALPSDFRALPVALQRRCIQVQLQRQKVPAAFDLIESMRLRPGHLIKVSPNLAVVLRSDGRIELKQSIPNPAPNSAFSEIILNDCAGKQVFEEVQFSWRTMSRRSRAKPKATPGRELFDADKVGRRIVLRHWRAGDRFQPIGMKSAAKLQDLFVNLKIPRELRHNLVLAEATTGEIFWVEKLRIGEQFKLSEATNRCLQWRWKRF